MWIPPLNWSYFFIIPPTEYRNIEHSQSWNSGRATVMEQSPTKVLNWNETNLQIPSTSQCMAYRIFGFGSSHHKTF